METARSESRTGGLWMLKTFSGVFIIIILIIHLLVNHLIGSANGLLTFEEVIQYYENWYIPAMELIFLVFVVTHALLGLRSIYLDFNPSQKALRTVNWILFAFGTGFVLYGSWLIIQIVQVNA